MPQPKKQGFVNVQDVQERGATAVSPICGTQRALCFLSTFGLQPLPCCDPDDMTPILFPWKASSQDLSEGRELAERKNFSGRRLPSSSSSSSWLGECFRISTSLYQRSCAFATAQHVGLAFAPHSMRVPTTFGISPLRNPAPMTIPTEGYRDSRMSKDAVPELRDQGKARCCLPVRLPDWPRLVPDATVRTVTSEALPCLTFPRPRIVSDDFIIQKGWGWTTSCSPLSYLFRRGAA